MDEVNRILDHSVAAEAYVINEEKTPYDSDEHLVDLSRLDFDALRQQFEKGRRRAQAEKLRRSVEKRLNVMVDRNRTRLDLLERFQRLIDEYNSGSMNFEEYLRQLMELTQEMNEEEQRGAAEGLSEEELALFDLLTKPDVKLSKSEEREVKKVAHELLETLKREKLVLDWRKRQQARASVRLFIEQELDKLPLDVYDKAKYDQKCDLAYQHIYDSYFGPGLSKYQTAA